eukprot:13180826-Ditylum_brightwellii.AAC.1
MKKKKRKKFIHSRYSHDFMESLSLFMRCVQSRKIGRALFFKPYLSTWHLLLYSGQVGAVVCPREREPTIRQASLCSHGWLQALYPGPTTRPSPLGPTY